MSSTDEMLKLWFEETVIPHLKQPEHKINPTAEMFVYNFRDYFSVRLRDVLPPHPISENLEELRNRKEITEEAEDTGTFFPGVKRSVDEGPHRF